MSTIKMDLVGTKAELMELWETRAKEERELAKAYEHFSKDRAFKLGLACGVERCVSEFKMWRERKRSKQHGENE